MKFRLDRRSVKIVLGLLAVLSLFLGVLFLLHTWEEGGPRTAEQDGYADQTGEEKTLYNGEWYKKRRGIETVLVLGIDKFSAEDGPTHGSYEQSDFLMLLILDKRNETCAALPINRDTMVEYEQLTDAGRSTGMAYGQITLAHAYGGDARMRCRNSLRAVSRLLYGVKIDHYLSLTMDGVAALNDMVGGVEVTIEDDFSQVDPSLVQGETVTLKGQQALTYVRTRKEIGDGSNEGRMRRQNQYLLALQEKLTSNLEMDSDFIMKALDEVNPYMESDCTVQKLSDLSERLSEYGVEERLSIEGETDTSGQYAEFHPDEEALQELVMEVFYEKVDA